MSTMLTMSTMSKNVNKCQQCQKLSTNANNVKNCQQMPTMSIMLKLQKCQECNSSASLRTNFWSCFNIFEHFFHASIFYALYHLIKTCNVSAKLCISCNDCFLTDTNCYMGALLKLTDKVTPREGKPTLSRSWPYAERISFCRMFWTVLLNFL